MARPTLSREKVQVTVELFSDQKEALKDKADEKGTTPTQILRDVLDSEYKLPKKK